MAEKHQTAVTPLLWPHLDCGSPCSHSTCLKRGTKGIHTKWRRSIVEPNSMLWGHTAVNAAAVMNKSSWMMCYDCLCGVSLRRNGPTGFWLSVSYLLVLHATTDTAPCRCTTITNASSMQGIIRVKLWVCHQSGWQAQLRVSTGETIRRKEKEDTYRLIEDEEDVLYQLCDTEDNSNEVLEEKYRPVTCRPPSGFCLQTPRRVRTRIWELHEVTFSHHTAISVVFFFFSRPEVCRVP